MNYRALIHGVRAARFWTWVENDRRFQMDNYIAAIKPAPRLMDLLAIYQGRGNAPRTRWRNCSAQESSAWMAPKLGRVQQGTHRGNPEFCETDVANTYLLLPTLSSGARRAR